jgi:putative FmdB family regulatory protein
MPLYEYYCSNCKSRFELIVNHQHADDIVCTRCHSEHVRRLLSTFAFPRGDSAESLYDDAAPSAGGCACGNGGCGCH